MCVDKEAYVSPTRGAQGNTLKTIVAIPFALDGQRGETVIEACGIKHTISFMVDPVRREPKVSRKKDASSIKNGTKIAVQWPVCASAELDAAKARFLQIASDFTFLNPHLGYASIGKARQSWTLREPMSGGTNGHQAIRSPRIGTPRSVLNG